MGVQIEYKKEVIKGFPNYEIDTNGVVYNKMGKPLLCNSKNGYSSVCLSKNGIQYVKRVHRLVMEQFTQEEEYKRYVVHLNGKKEDNRIENLAWSDSNYEGYLESTKEVREEMKKIKHNDKEMRRKSHIVIAYNEDDSEYKRYKSVADAARDFTDNEHSGKVFICNAMKKGKKAYGYYWRKLEDVEDKDEIDKKEELEENNKELSEID